jgi:hypothetical protein
MDSKTQLRAAILKTVEQELDAFLDIEKGIKESKEYEKALWVLAMGVARGVLAETAESRSSDRNKKKDPDDLRSDTGQ